MCKKSDYSRAILEDDWAYGFDTNTHGSHLRTKLILKII